MQKYTDLVLGQNSQTLVPVVGASVTVLTFPGGTPATVYSDNGITPTTNPLTTDMTGRFSFYAANGRYSLQITYQTVSYTIQDIPLLDDPANGQTVVITGGSIDNTPIGATTPSTGAFTTLSATGAFTGAGGSFTTLSASSTVSGAGFTALFASPPSIGNTAANSGAFTTLSASSTVSGTGFSTYLASPPAIGGTAAAAGSFTTLSATGNFTPSQTNGIVGTTTTNNANAGSVGEIITASFTSVSLTNNTSANATSISLTAGDWDVCGGFQILGSGSVITDSVGGSSSTSASFSVQGTYSELTASAYSNFSCAIPTVRFSLSATTSIYMVVRASFASGTVTSSGILRARRIR